MEEKYGKGLCPFKDAFLETIKREYPDLKVVEGTHPFHDPVAFKAGIKELISQRVVTPQTINDLVFKRMKLPPNPQFLNSQIRFIMK